MEQDKQARKITTYFGMILALFFILILRLAVVQIMENDQYQIRASDNRIRLLPMKAARGEIYMADGVKAAGNELVYTVRLNRADTAPDDAEIERLASILREFDPEITADSVRLFVENANLKEDGSVVVCRNVPWELVVRLEENRQNIPGLSIDIEPYRVYPQKEIGGHVIGYIHSISEEELQEAEQNVYQPDSLVGKSGIEKEYEEYLRGVPGARRVEVDSRGRMVQELVTLQPESGNNLCLTLDSRLQTVMDGAMNQAMAQVQQKFPRARVASAVLLDVKTGKVLAMTSKPDMYPEDWRGNISVERAAYYFPQGEKYDPMNPGAATNRAVQSAYPPGSTFKPITGMAALDAGVLSPERDTVNCAGRYWISPYIRCTGEHGNVNYDQAMAVSCNVYFQEAGRLTGKEEIVRVGKEFGLGERTGIDLPYETKGLLPTPEWKREVNETLLTQSFDAKMEKIQAHYEELLEQASSDEQKEQLKKEQEKEERQLDIQYQQQYAFDTKWHDYDTFNMSIGQGYNSFTMIQLADYIAAVANGGSLMKPYLVEKIVSEKGEIVKKNEPEVVRKVDVKDSVLAATRRGMLQVTQPGGTAYSLFADFPAAIQVGAKTGTAETGRVGDRPLTDCHGVFVAFAPYDDPQIAFAGLMEYGFSGYSSAGIVCKEVFEQYFGLHDYYTEMTAGQ